MKRSNITKQYIFWCYTPGHEEDWFIQATSLKEATETHAKFEGFDPDEPKARLICEVPKNLFLKSPNWPTENKLKKLGFEFLQEEQPRVVRYNGILYKEGIILDYILRYPHFKKPQVYLMKIRGQNHYKIGFSENLYRRKKGILGNSPYHLDIIGTIRTPMAKQLEVEVRTKFKKFISATEWITLDDWGASILSIVFEAYRREFVDSLSNHYASSIFHSLIKKLMSLLDGHVYNTKPPRSYIVKLNNLYDLICEIPNNNQTIKDNAISQIKIYEKQIEELKEHLILNHPIKKGSIVLNKEGHKFYIQEIEVYIHKDYKPKASYVFKTKKVLRNGKIGKNSYYLFSNDISNTVSIDT